MFFYMTRNKSFTAVMVGILCTSGLITSCTHRATKEERGLREGKKYPAEIRRTEEGVREYPERIEGDEEKLPKGQDEPGGEAEYPTDRKESEEGTEEYPDNDNIQI